MREDGQRAMRLVRADASKWNLIRAASAWRVFRRWRSCLDGCLQSGDGDTSATDPIDRVSCRLILKSYLSGPAEFLKCCRPTRRLHFFSWRMMTIAMFGQLPPS
jgi:hypothetical protein